MKIICYIYENVINKILIIKFTAWPDIEEKPVTKDLEFIVLACDGIWDVMTNEVMLLKN